jgi:hypothetical protein
LWIEKIESATLAKEWGSWKKHLSSDFSWKTGPFDNLRIKRTIESQIEDLQKIEDCERKGVNGAIDVDAGWDIPNWRDEQGQLTWVECSLFRPYSTTQTLAI